MIIKRQTIDAIENKLQSFEERYNDLKNKMSSIRKSGKDTIFAEIRLLDYMPLKAMAKITYDQDDLDRIGRLLDTVDKELDAVSFGDEFEHILECIREAYEHFRNSEKEKAILMYKQIKSMYTCLDEDSKRIIYQACRDLHKKIENGRD